jgi:hypothetical protein
MPTLSKKKAVEALREEVCKARPDDLVEIHNELFPGEPTTEKAAQRDPGTLTAKILGHIEAGLEVEEILGLWGVVFPGSRDVWYDEEKNRVHYEKDEEAVPTE